MIGRLAQANKRVILACGMAGWLVLAGGVLAQRQEPGPKVLEEVGEIGRAHV